MRRIGILGLIMVIIVITGCTRNEDPVSFSTGGRFSGVAEGYRDTISAEIEVNNGAITDIKIKGVNQSHDHARAAETEMVQAIIANQSLQVEAVSGATITSLAIKEAVEKAIEAAGIEVSYFYMGGEAKKTQMPSEDKRYDYVVLGAGAAGLTAAIQGAMNGKSVVLIEKLPFAGGNSALSGGEMSVPESDLQKKHKIEDRPEIMVQDMVDGARGTGSVELIRVLCENINQTVQWLETTAGLEFKNRVYLVKGHSVPRTIIPVGLGAGVVDRLLALAEANGVQVYYNTKATELIAEDSGRVAGVLVERGGETFSILANERTVLATGGFGANVQMREFYNTRWTSLDEDVLTSNSPGITGDGIRMAEGAGAALVDMEFIQLFPYNNPASGQHYYLDTIRTNAGAFFVNQEGRRFVNEDEVRDVVAGRILEQTAQTSYEVFNQSIIDTLADDPVAMEEVDRWLNQGVLIKRDTLEECAEYFGINKGTMLKTLEQYNRFIESGEDLAFDRELDFEPLEEGPFYMLEGVPSVHYTMGGVAINRNAEVLDTEGNVIPDLYAAGEVTGGIHGENRLGACAVPDALVFGRIAGGYEPVRKKSGQ